MTWRGQFSKDHKIDHKACVTVACSYVYVLNLSILFYIIYISKGIFCMPGKFVNIYNKEKISL